MNQDSNFSNLAQIFHLQDLTNPENRAKLWLLRACGEVGKPHRNHEYTQDVLWGWLQVVLPGSGKPLISRWLDACQDTFDPSWMKQITQDEEAAILLPSPLLLGAILATWPPDLGDHHKSVHYLQTAAGYCGGLEEIAHELMGWLRATATPEKFGYISSLIEIWSNSSLAKNVTQELRRRVRTPSTVEDTGFARKFKDAQHSLGAFLDILIARGETFNLPTHDLKMTKDRILNEHFRVAVLGEFKRGKSTLINALLGKPDFLPADELPCTSSLIELRHGSTERYEYASDHSYEPKNRREFIHNAGNAARDSSRSPQDVGRWRVILNSEFLERTQFELVDTPGLGEDPARDNMAKGEAKRADAALIVLNAKQISSTQELDLIGSMDSKMENVILVINQADLVEKASWTKLQAHVLRKLEEKNIPFRADRIVFVSALFAEQALRQGNRNEWSKRLEVLEQAIWDNLAIHRGAKKASALCSQIKKMCRETRVVVEETRKLRQKDVQDVIDAAQKVADAKQLRKGARYSIDVAKEKLMNCDQASEALWNNFQGNLPSIFESVRVMEGYWTSTHHELLSPKKHIEEVAQKIQGCLLEYVKEWAQKSGGKVVSRHLEKRLEEIKEDLEPLRRYVESVSGDKESLMNKLFIHTLQDAFPGSLSDADEMTALMRVAIMTALALVVGYVIADIILYYILGVISGFVNPILLAAALVASVGVYAWKGRDWVQAWIRSRVFDSVKEGFENEDNKKKMKKSFGEATEKIFSEVALSFEKRARTLLEEMNVQLGRREAKLREVQDRVGGDLGKLKAELDKIEQEAREVLRAVEQLETLVERVRARMDLQAST